MRPSFTTCVIFLLIRMAILNSFLCRVEIANRYLDLVRQLVPRARIVFNTVDLHFLRELREAELLDQPELFEGLGERGTRKLTRSGKPMPLSF